MESKFVLTETDGYSISTSIYCSLEESQNAMKKAYEDLMPIENDESSMEMSSLGEMSAILYANGETVYVWDITEVQFEKKRDEIKESINNDAYLHSCNCPECGNYISRGCFEKILYCDKCGQKLHLREFTEEEYNAGRFQREMDDYED